MLLKNEGTVAFATHVRMNPNEKIEVSNGEGGTFTKNAIPLIKTIYVPAGATVEIEDVLWNLAWNIKMNGFEIHDLEREIGTKELGQPKIKDKVLTVQVRTLGAPKIFYPVQDAVKQGKLVLLELPKLGLTREEILAKVEGSLGFELPEEISNEKLREMYDKHC
jgi:hypothetical protein